MSPGNWLVQTDFVLLALPVIVLLVLSWARGEAAQKAVALPGFAWLPPASGHGMCSTRVGNTLRAVALIALVPLVAGPPDGADEDNRDTAAALVVVLDNSSSMTAGDFRPLNRLEAAKRSLRAFMSKLGETELGLVALAAAPQVVAPVTRDRRFVLAALEKVGPAAYEDDGTAIGTGVASAVNRLRREEGAARRILLITDGVSNRGTASSADVAEAAQAMGIRVDAIGIGTDTISRFHVPTANGAQQEVEARIEIDDRALDALSTRTGGTYHRVRNIEELEQVLAGIEASYAGPQASSGREVQRKWMAVLALFSLGMLGTELLLRHFVFREIPQ